MRTASRYSFDGREQTVREIHARYPVYALDTIRRACIAGAHSRDDIERHIAAGQARRRAVIKRNRMPPMWPEPNSNHTALPSRAGRMVRL